MPRLYAIVDREVLQARGVGLRTFAVELREAGVRLVQYRDKVGGPQEVLRAAAEIAEVFAGTDATLILNDRADLTVLAGWDGVHVGQGDLAVEDARRVVGAGGGPTSATMEPSRRWRTRQPMSPNARDMGHPSVGWPTSEMRGIVGVSTHTEEQVRAAEASGADYVAIGPVFATGTKLNAERVVGLEGVRRARALTGKPLVAIGGITRERARSVIEAGADSVAVISGLLQLRQNIQDWM